MSRVKEWLGSDSSFEDAETNGNDWRQIKAGQCSLFRKPLNQITNPMILRASNLYCFKP